MVIDNLSSYFTELLRCTLSWIICALSPTIAVNVVTNIPSKILRLNADIPFFAYESVKPRDVVMSINPDFMTTSWSKFVKR